MLLYCTSSSAALSVARVFGFRLFAVWDGQREELRVSLVTDKERQRIEFPPSVDEHDDALLAYGTVLLPAAERSGTVRPRCFTPRDPPGAALESEAGEAPLPAKFAELSGVRRIKL